MKEAIMNMFDAPMPFALIAFCALSIERVRELCLDCNRQMISHLRKHKESYSYYDSITLLLKATLQLLLHLHRSLQILRRPKQNTRYYQIIPRTLLLEMHATAWDVYQGIPILRSHLRFTCFRFRECQI